MPWIIGCEVVLLTIGFAKISTVVLNRLLALPQPKWVMGVTELIQLSFIPIYALLLTANINHGETRKLLESPSWNTVLSSESVLLVIGAVGFVLLIRSTIGYQRYRSPDCQIGVNSKIVDFRRTSAEQSWQNSMVGPRPMRQIALLPGNEQFTVEINEKTFLLPRLPKEWNSLSIVHLTDTHFRGAVSRQYFEAVCQQALALKPDLFVFTGDLLDDPSLLDWLPETLGRLKAPLGEYFILGNHDWYFDTAAIRHEFERLGWIDLAGRCRSLVSHNFGPPIILAGDETPWMGTHPDLKPESKEFFHILLSHTPDNIQWAREHGIDLMLSGHTHGGQIRLPILGPVYSPSRHGCRFASGDFWLDPTLLCVSRGLSGREPVRYNCRPELTKLILVSNASKDGR